MTTYDSTVKEVDDWFDNESGILESCLEKENSLSEFHQDGDHMCPYFVAFLELADANVHKGWTVEELKNAIDDMYAEKVD